MERVVSASDSCGKPETSQVGGDVVERAKNSLNMYAHCRAAGIDRGVYPERLMSELVAEVELWRSRCRDLGWDL